MSGPGQGCNADPARGGARGHAAEKCRFRLVQGGWASRHDHYRRRFAVWLRSRRRRSTSFVRRLVELVQLSERFLELVWIFRRIRIGESVQVFNQLTEPSVSLSSGIGLLGRAGPIEVTARRFCQSLED